LEENPQMMDELEFLMRQQAGLPVDDFEGVSYVEEGEELLVEA
jgi:hypothetical protein